MMSYKLQEYINAQDELAKALDVVACMNKGVAELKEKVQKKKDALLLDFKETGECEFETDNHKAIIKKTPARLVILDETKVPQSFIKTVTSVDNTSLKKYLNAGNNVEYAKLESDYTIQVRVK